MRSFLQLTALLVTMTAGSLAAQPADEHAEKIANIRKMIQLTGGAKIVDQIFDSMTANFKDPKQQEFFHQFRQELDINQLYELIILAYDKYLSGDDIKEIVRFYQTPTGRHLLDAQPKIIGDFMPKVNQWSQEIVQRLMAKMKEKGLQ
jgi:hypothetical protein